MKKQDYVIIAVLVGLLFAWPKIDRFIGQHFFHKQASPSTASRTLPQQKPPEPSSTNAPVTPAIAAPIAAPTPAAPLAAADGPATAAPAIAQLTNQHIRLSFTSRGAGLARAELPGYRSRIAKDSPPVELDFTSVPALSYDGLPALGTAYDFTLRVESNVLRAERTTAAGLRLVRTVELTDRFLLQIRDEISNGAATSVLLTNVAVHTGFMQREPGHVDASGFFSLGVDSRAPGSGVVHWGAEIPKRFSAFAEQHQQTRLPAEISGCDLDTNGIDWVATKNKYFVQILTPEDTSGGREDWSADRVWLSARRTIAPGETALPDASVKMTTVDAVSAAMVYDTLEVPAGGTKVHAYSYYIGPKELSQLDHMTLNRDEVMEIGEWLKPIAKILLKTLNAIYNVIPNYGVAIMLLTVIVRLVFWPITHKSSQSMKRMAEIQPLVKEVQAKYQKDPKRMQAEMMRIYKENKINPVAGCLPMLIQIPFFFALFLVLRSAIELRFADFLWITDLSEPERIFTLPFSIPLLGSDINLLPIVMAGTMYWQQKITPTAGDPNQAKMMRIMMTGMMLFFLYGYPAGLALYWTTQNLLMIAQQLWNQRTKPKTA